MTYIRFSLQLRWYDICDWRWLWMAMVVDRSMAMVVDISMMAMVHVAHKATLSACDMWARLGGNGRARHFTRADRHEREKVLAVYVFSFNSPDIRYPHELMISSPPIFEASTHDISMHFLPQTHVIAAFSDPNGKSRRLAEKERILSQLRLLRSHSRIRKYQYGPETTHTEPKSRSRPRHVIGIRDSRFQPLLSWIMVSYVPRAPIRAFKANYTSNLLK